MIICNIYPIKNQYMYKSEKMSMVLAHLVKKGYYKPKNFENSYVIMDNGLYEKQQVSTSLDDLIHIAVKSKIKVDEIVVPDVVNNSYSTYELFIKNLATMILHPQYTYMFVCQGENPREVATQIRMMNGLIELFNRKQGLRDLKLKVSLAVSKLCDFNRDHPALIDAYQKSNLPIHFLGLKTSFSELEKVKNYIRSCDSCQLTHLMYNDPNILKEELSLYVAHRDHETDHEINLEKDKVKYELLIEGKEKLDEELQRRFN